MVKCVDPAGEVLGGVTLSLCPVGQEAATGSADCQHAATDRSGRGWLREVPPGSYLLRADQTGWADTTVGPLNIGHGEPKSPERLTIVLNPVCFGC